MDEENQQEVQQESMVDKANEAAARLEEANKKQEELLKRQEALRVKETLGGQTEVRQAKQEMSDSEYANLAIEGKLRFNDEK